MRKLQRRGDLHDAAAHAVGGRGLRDLDEFGFERAEAAGPDDDPVVLFPRALALRHVDGEMECLRLRRGRRSQCRPADATGTGARIDRIWYALGADQAQDAAYAHLDTFHRTIVASLAGCAVRVAVSGEGDRGAGAGMIADRTGGGADPEQPPVGDGNASGFHLQGLGSFQLRIGEVGKHQLAAGVDRDLAQTLGAGEVLIDHHVRSASARAADRDVAIGVPSAGRQRNRSERAIRAQCGGPDGPFGRCLEGRFAHRRDRRRLRTRPIAVAPAAAEHNKGGRQNAPQ